MSRLSRGQEFRRYTEAQARQMALSRLASDFHFFEEVCARDPSSGDSYRLDAVSVCEATGYVLGWEFKPSHLFKSEFAKALRQAIYYRNAHFADPRYPWLADKKVAACIVCPDWDGLHEDGLVEHAKEADGMRLLASHFRVGALRESVKNSLCIIVGEQAIWHSASGWTKNAPGVLTGKRPRASGKSRDVNLA